MEASWPQRFHDLDPQAQLVVRACAVIDHFSLSQVAAAAVLGVPLSQVADTFVAVAAASWGEVVDDELAVAADARPFLQRLLRLTPPDDVRAMIEKTAAAVEHAMAGTAPMSSGVRSNVLGVLRAANRIDAADIAAIAARVARAAWDILVPGPIVPGSDLAWWRAVADEGEQAASRSRQPRLLAELLDLSAQAYSAAHDWRAAEAAWTRALFLMDRLGDADEFTRHLELLAANYHDAGQATALAETLVELVERYERDDKSDSAASTSTSVSALVSALARLGATMLDSGRLDSAILYLGRADQLLEALPETRDLRIRHALVLCDLGRAHAHGHALNRARTCYRDALTLVVDLDQAVARRIRDLQAALQESPT